MKLIDNQLNKESFSKVGEEVCRLLVAGDFQRLADAFGYAMAYNRDIAAAIQDDFEKSLLGFSRTERKAATATSVTVQNLKSNDIGLLSVVVCVLAVDGEARVLIELVVARNGENVNLYIEEISSISTVKQSEEPPQ